MSPMRRMLTLALLAGPAVAEAQRPAYSPTLMWDSGLLQVPAAWVSPLHGDVTASASVLRGRLGAPTADPDRPQTTVPVAVSLWGRVEGGLTFFTADFQTMAFARALVWNQLDGEFRGGVRHWLPSVAVGVRNLGQERGVDRFAQTGTPVRAGPTLYAVATRTQVLARDEDGAPRVQVGATAGFGNGLFAKDGGLGTFYSETGGTGGAFGGVTLDLKPSRFSTLTLMGEHDAWDVNVGAALDVRGLLFKVAVLEAGAGAKESDADLNFQKVAFSVGFQTNALALLRGDRMTGVIEQKEQAQTQLRRDIDAASRRIVSLEQQLRALEGRATTDAAAQRAELERLLREEQEALKRLQERLRKPGSPEGR